MATIPNGVVVWQGPSLLTGAPIGVILTGLRDQSENPKTGPMLQTWILTDRHPVTAAKEGWDAAVCGDCPLRPENGGGCYVRVETGPTAVWRAWRVNGAYPAYDSAQHDGLIRGRAIRFGAYGDPCAAPYRVWADLARLSGGWTGYTHQWADPQFWRFRQLLMASIETPRQAVLAWHRGWRTFRIGLTDGHHMMGTEIHCPASAENDRRTVCAQCQLCCGRSARTSRHVYILGHGRSAVKSALRQLASGT